MIAVVPGALALRVRSAFDAGDGRGFCPGSGRRWSVVAVLVVLIGFVLRWPGLGRALSGDEADSLAVARHGFAGLWRLSALDASPPGWPAVVHLWGLVVPLDGWTLHLLCSLVVVLGSAALWWLVRVLGGGSRSACLAAGGLALSPWAASYGTDGRVYALAGVVAVLVVGCWWRGVVQAGSRWWFLLASLSAGGLLWLHVWGVFLLVGLGVVSLALCVFWLRGSAGRAVLVRLCWWTGAVLLVFAPWLPELVGQVARTAAPWAMAPSSVLSPVVDVVRLAVGLGFPLVVVGVVVGVRRLGPVRLSAGVVWFGASVVLVGSAVLVALVLGAVVGVVVPSWSARYLGVVLVPALAVLALVWPLGRVWSALAGVVALVLVLFGLPWSPPGWPPFAASVSDAASVVAWVGAPPALVVDVDSYEVPALRFAGGSRWARVRWFGASGLDPHPAWDSTVGEVAALRRPPVRSLAALVAGLPVGSRVLVAGFPVPPGRASSFDRLGAGAQVAVDSALCGVRVVGVFDPAWLDHVAAPVRAVLVERVAGPCGPVAW